MYVLKTKTWQGKYKNNDFQSEYVQCMSSDCDQNPYRNLQQNVSDALKDLQGISYWNEYFKKLHNYLVSRVQALFIVSLASIRRLLRF